VGTEGPRQVWMCSISLPSKAPLSFGHNQPVVPVVEARCANERAAVMVFIARHVEQNEAFLEWAEYHSVPVHVNTGDDPFR